MGRRARLTWNIPTALVVGLETLFVYFHVRNDPDPYHSGFVYAQSIAVQNGLLPQINFLSPYGVVGPLINGLWLELTSDSLLSLLLLYGFITVVIGYLIQVNVRMFAPEILAKLLNFSWVITLATAMPWPSILTTLFTLSAVTILLKFHSDTRSDSFKNHLFLIPMVALLYAAVLSRIHLVITPVLISLVILCYRKNFSGAFIRNWFAINLTTFGFVIFGLHSFKMLSGFIDQVIVWPLTQFESPPINASFMASFIWFPISLLIVYIFTKFAVKSQVSTNRIYSNISVFLIIFFFFFIYLLSVHDYGSANINTLKTSAGFLSNLSVNLQFILGYSSISYLSLGFLFFVKRSRGKVRLVLSNLDLTSSLMIILVITGLIQLYPLHDNVHLWFVTPLFLGPTIFFIRLLSKRSLQIFRALALLLCCFIPIQSVAFFHFLSERRVPLTSYELRGMYAEDYVQINVDETMKLLNSKLTVRNLRNNCIASLYSTSNGKFHSIDGNFSANFFGNFVSSVPVVDPISQEPTYLFECQINEEAIEEVRLQGWDIAFQRELIGRGGSPTSLYNVLFLNARNS